MIQTVMFTHFYMWICVYVFIKERWIDAKLRPNGRKLSVCLSNQMLLCYQVLRPLVEILHVSRQCCVVAPVGSHEQRHERGPIFLGRDFKLHYMWQTVDVILMLSDGCSSLTSMVSFTPLSNQLSSLSSTCKFSSSKECPFAFKCKWSADPWPEELAL